jgi:flavin-dependent dehydrogenase
MDARIPLSLDRPDEVTSYDAIVIGGGPAGSTCARDLTWAGARVLVVDRAARFPRDKVCAGWITPHVVRALGLDPSAYAREHTIQPITGFVSSAVGRAEVHTSYDSIISYAIRRCEFDHYLLERSGAAVETGVPVQGLERVRDRWVVDGRFESPMLIGAGGHFCPVARTLNPVRDAGPVVVAQECEFRMTPAQAAACAIDPYVPALYFCADRRGYGWCVRKDDFLNIGFGRIGDSELPRRVAEFLAFLIRERKVPGDAPARWPGHAYRLYARPQRKLVDAGVVLIGDSAGLAHPVSGEGILPAVESGRLAAATIVGAAGNVSRDRLAPYAGALAQRYGSPGQAAGEPWLLPSSVASWIAVRLMGMPWFVRHVLIDRWFLHRDLKPLDAIVH